MNNSSLPVTSDKAFININKSMIEGDIISGSLNAMQSMAGKPAQSCGGGMSFSDQSDFLKNWYSLDAGNVANFKA